MLRQLKIHKVLALGFLLYLLVATFFLTSLEKGEMIFYFDQFRGSDVDSVFKIITRFGEGVTYVASAVLLFFFRRKAILALPLVGGMAALMSFLLKSLFRMGRPYRIYNEMGVADQLIWVDGIHINQGLTSFPSGHTIAAFSLFVFLALAIRRQWASVLFLVLAIMVGISRVYLGQHFFADVYFGSLIGLCIAVLFWWIFERVENRKWLAWMGG
jgi:membrane-associated phospholipid phosphatase